MALPFYVAAFLLAHGAASAATPQCGPLKIPGKFGPVDYRAPGEIIHDVQRFHFSPAVEHLLARNPGPDLAYTLWSFPNHHRALMTLVKLGERDKTLHAPGMPYPIECYFERAIRFQHEDLVVRMIYAGFLHRQGRTSHAVVQLDFVAERAKVNPLTHYNLGLLYFEMKDYAKAEKHGRSAKEFGIPATELRAKLQGVGRWTEQDSGRPHLGPLAAPASDAREASSPATGDVSRKEGAQ